MPSFKRATYSLLILFSLLSPAMALAQGVEPADDELQTGLIGSYRDQTGHACQRVDPQIAFDWRQAPPDRRLAEGPYSVQWRGYLMSQARGSYRLSVHAAGKVKLTLGERVVIDAESDTAQWLHSEPMDLAFDWHPLEVAYTSLAHSGRISLFWSGPDFSLEPVSPRQLFHEPAETPADMFDRGEQLVRGLGCAACHRIAGEAQPLAAPSLLHLKGSLEPAWLVDWLTSADEREQPPTPMRRMPHFSLAEDEAQAITAFLWAESQPISLPEIKIEKPAKAKKPEVQEGRRLVHSRGCLACHQLGELGRSGLFGGGDLGAIGSKRPDHFFRQWLLAPESLNEAHRMPVYDFNEEELAHIAEYLQTLAGERPAARFDAKLIEDEEWVARGKQLVAKHQCDACHALPDAKPPTGQGRGGELTARSAWEKSCTASAALKDRPHYSLNDEDRQAIEVFVGQLAEQSKPLPVNGSQLLVERNCLACHQREGRHGLAELLPAIGARDGKLNGLLPALQPPALTSVGDKLTEEALHRAIARQGPVQRPWLEVQMPRFGLEESQEQAIVDHLIAADRIPAGHGMQLAASVPESEAVLRMAGQRLVTSAGFGCTSCHAVGDVQPPKGPLAAKGPDLLMLNQRIRRPWFDRWVRNPARIVPRMEMPSVQLATPGVLNDNLDSQLAAVWEVLNLPDFRPPEPGPVRVVRASGVAERDERAAVLTDVLNLGEEQFIKPLLIGLPNRHNVMFDLHHGRLAAWWLGDTAQQRTQGKTWFWTAGGENLLSQPSLEPELKLKVGTKEFLPIRRGQFITSLDGWKHDSRDAVTFSYQLTFADVSGNQHLAQVEETWSPIKTMTTAGEQGFARRVIVKQLPARGNLQLNFTHPEKRHARIEVHQPTPDAAFPTPRAFAAIVDGQATFSLDYYTTLPVDRFPQELPPVALPEPARLESVPGFAATRLSLPTDVMPTALAWAANGDLYLTSLKGRVWHGQRIDGDENRFQWSVFSDELAAPFGIAVGKDYVDVLNKYALLRLTDGDQDGFAESSRVLAAGWGHTADYHDWAVGLEQDQAGNYYVAIPCEQDGRSLAAAHWRGKVLRIDPRRGEITELTGGHRFPIGIARNRRGELFVSDNQGNYNPFNELNHVQPGRRYGFLNSTEKKQKDFQPELTAPAIDIPHPWTRSVNGICFLETPEALRAKGIENIFGPWEGHLVGCEYDTRRLIRLSLDRVGDTIQGAAYPLSILPRSRHDETFLGPISCAVSPAGELLIGNIRDSGWGGGSNIGSLVSMRFDKETLPAGIREVRAEPQGLRIDFTTPLDAQRLADRDHYAISSYTRISTPAYGGDDQDRRRETVRRIEVGSERTSVLLMLDSLRGGYVYEIKLSGLSDNDDAFHPADAYYTMRRVPE